MSAITRDNIQEEIDVRKLMFFLIGLLAVVNLISAYASYNNDRFEDAKEITSTPIISDIDINQK